MPLFEVETEAHIIITWAGDEGAATEVVGEAYPTEKLIRMTKRPRDTWVISKSALGIAGRIDPFATPPAIASPRPPATKSMRSASICTRRAPIWSGARKVIESNDGDGLVIEPTMVRQCRMASEPATLRRGVVGVSLDCLSLLAAGFDGVALDC